MKAGDQVRHPLLGSGTIVAVHTRGGEVGADVDFGYMTDWVPAAAVGLDTGGTTARDGPCPRPRCYRTVRRVIAAGKSCGRAARRAGAEAGSGA